MRAKSRGKIRENTGIELEGMGKKGREEVGNEKGGKGKQKESNEGEEKERKRGMARARVEIRMKEGVRKKKDEHKKGRAV